MFKIITTKRYSELLKDGFRKEVYKAGYELMEMLVDKKDLIIKRLELDLAIEIKANQEKEVVNVYKLQLKPTPERDFGPKFSGTKSELDKFIKKNSTKKAKKEHEA